MKDYKAPWVRNFDTLEELDKEVNSLFAKAVSIIILFGLTLLLAHSCVDATVKEVELREQYYGKPYQSTLSRPAAYRLASPTFEQMDSLHALRTCQRGLSEWYGGNHQ